MKLDPDAGRAKPLQFSLHLFTEVPGKNTLTEPTQNTTFMWP